jgi:dihydrofolate reductase
MKKLIAAINMTLDGFCDHTAGIADDEIHEHFNEILRNADTFLYGRITYQLMESYWPSLVKNPSGNKPNDEFAVLIDNVPKIVFSRTLKSVSWKNSELKKEILKEDILELKQSRSQSPVDNGGNKNIYVGSPSLIVALTQLDLIDEYHIVVQPFILGSGLTLFKNIRDKINLKLLKTKTFGCGAIALDYERIKK